jgi:membrane associated rhomboid family serine protease
VFPLHDLNPTIRRPVATLLFIAANLVVWLFFQPHGTVEEEIRFLYEYAVISCEVVRNAPLTVTEVLSGRCLPDPPGPEAFPGKQVGLSLLASMFFHGGLFHLAGNMWFLWIFGNNVEDRLGHITYIALYLATGVAGTAAFVLMRPEEVTPLVGASGAVAGVLGAYLVIYPRHSVVSLVGWWILPIPAGIFLAVWFFA